MNFVQALTKSIWQTLLMLQMWSVKYMQMQYLGLKESTMLGSSIVQTLRQLRNARKSKQTDTGNL